MLNTLRQALGATSPPRTITQEAFDYDRAHLHHLVRLEPGAAATPVALWDYMQDLRYTEIQRELFTYLLPVCLQAWHDDLRGVPGRDYGAFVDEFYPVLADRQIFETQLTPEQSAAVSEFIRESILAEIDEQRGLAYQGMNVRPYRWVRALTTYGVLLPDIERLWTSWWAVGTVGRAVSSLQYISALMYADDANPVFAPSTRDEGGGPPTLWEFQGHLYSHRWLEPNVDFLGGALNVSAVDHVVSRAVEVLQDLRESEVATRMRADMPACVELLAARCAELPRLLATTQKADGLMEWSI